LSQRLTKYPEAFDENQYIRWHEQRYPQDIPLKSSIENFRISLPEKFGPYLEKIKKLFQDSRDELEKNFGRIQIPLLDENVDIKDADNPNLFKQDRSILNKLWRKNREKENASLANIEDKIKDLVRTEIIVVSLDSAGKAARLFNSLFTKRSVIHLDEDFKRNFLSVHFESEMKPSTGYFAYHGSIKFSDSKEVEIQIYSSLMSSWRKLSHILYTQRRSIGKSRFQFDTVESRIISLGHLLHLAECELLRTTRSLVLQKPKRK